MDGIGWASSAMVAARSRLEIATENLANVSTDGYRKLDGRGFLTAAGVAVERSRSAAHGALRRTARADDLAIVGSGAFRLRSPDGSVVLSRNGAFTRDRNGFLLDASGRTLLGKHGPVRLADNAAIDQRGAVMRDGVELDRLALPRGSSVRTGFLESSSVDAIGEMIDVLTAQRSFESAEKVVSAIDQTRQKADNDVAKLK
jgi:flagellar basal-body rod protein FlgF